MSFKCESGRAEAGRFLGPIIRRVWDTTRARFAGRLVDDALDLRVASMFRSLAGERSPAVRRVDGVQPWIRAIPDAIAAPLHRVPGTPSPGCSDKDTEAAPERLARPRRVGRVLRVRLEVARELFSISRRHALEAARFEAVLACVVAPSF